MFRYQNRPHPARKCKKKRKENQTIKLKSINNYNLMNTPGAIEIINQTIKA